MSRTVVMNNKFIPSDFLPIGFLGYLPYSAVPAGWLVCDGTVYNVADYPELAAKIGNTYGGDGATTFAVPDDRGLFRRGLDLAKGDDPARTLGTRQEDALQNITGTANVDGIPVTPTGAFYSPGSNQSRASGSTSGYYGLAFDASRVVRTADETRPKNRAYVPIIKAKNIYYDMTIQGGNAASLGGNPASYYAAASQAAKLTDFSGIFAQNGYRKLPDGTMIQWGLTNSASPITVIFPTAFPVACYNVTCDYNAAQYSSTNPGIANVTASGCVIYHGGVSTIFWQAIGK